MGWLVEGGGVFGCVPCSRDFDVWRVKCGISRLGRTFRMSCDCWGFTLLSNFFFMSWCFDFCVSFVTSSKFCL